MRFLRCSCSIFTMTGCKKQVLPTKGRHKPKSEEHKKKISEAHKGMKKPWAGQPKGYKPSKQAKINHSLGARKGKDNPNWRGGVTPLNTKIRHSLEYKLWRTSVFERDGHKCIWCGCMKSGSLNADHIKPFSLFPELRFAIDNGRTLCVPCHKTTDTYGSRMKLYGKIIQKSGATN